MFRNIDFFFLSHFEKGCHSLQRLTGKTNYYYAGLCCFLIVFISLGVYFGLLPKELFGKNGVIYDANSPTWFWVGIALFTGYFLGMWRLSERAAFIRLSNGLANPNKKNFLDRLTRLFFIITVPLMLLSPAPIYDKGFFVLLALFSFLVDCDPLPPCAGKAKEWLKSFKRNPALTPIKIKGE